jgi:uncharacterized membrane protein
VAALGVLDSVVVLVATATWWRRGDRRALYIAYGLGLVGTLMVAYLTYLELFVIHAICRWCVGSAVIITSVLVFALLELRRLRRVPAGGAA